MAKIVLTGDGQTFDLEDEIARDDELLRSVVKSVSPAYAEPTFRRETGKDGALTVHVSKQAKTKGAGALDVLVAAPGAPGPVETMRARLDALARARRLTLDAALTLADEARAAVAAGQAEQKIVRRAVSLLSATSEAVAADYIPTGF